MSVWAAQDFSAALARAGLWRLKALAARHAKSVSFSAVGAALVLGHQEKEWPRLSSHWAWPWSAGGWASESEAVLQEANDITVGGFQFKYSKVIGGQRLKAQGCCHLKYCGWEVCSAVLYLPEETEMPLAGADVMDASLPKILELRYFRSFPGEQFRWVTRWAMSRNGHLDETVEAKVTAFNALYRDVGHGDCYTLGYDPAGEGLVSLELNGCELGNVQGRRFSQGIFSVWFGERPFMQQLKEELLRGKP